MSDCEISAWWASAPALAPAPGGSGSLLTSNHTSLGTCGGSDELTTWRRRGQCDVVLHQTLQQGSSGGILASGSSVGGDVSATTCRDLCPTGCYGGFWFTSPCEESFGPPGSAALYTHSSIAGTVYARVECIVPWGLVSCVVMNLVGLVALLNWWQQRRRRKKQAESAAWMTEAQPPQPPSRHVATPMGSLPIATANPLATAHPLPQPLHVHNSVAVGPQPLAFAGELRPPRLNHQPLDVHNPHAPWPEAGASTGGFELGRSPSTADTSRSAAPLSIVAATPSPTQPHPVAAPSGGASAHPPPTPPTLPPPPPPPLPTLPSAAGAGVGSRPSLGAAGRAVQAGLRMETFTVLLHTQRGDDDPARRCAAPRPLQS
jgi:hypothetical protein